MNKKHQNYGQPTIVELLIEPDCIIATSASLGNENFTDDDQVIDF